MCQEFCLVVQGRFSPRQNGLTEKLRKAAEADIEALIFGTKNI
jgi:hypothetical protein